MFNTCIIRLRILLRMSILGFCVCHLANSWSESFFFAEGRVGKPSLALRAAAMASLSLIRHGLHPQPATIANHNVGKHRPVKIWFHT
jgi:hypothetical protein